MPAKLKGRKLTQLTVDKDGQRHFKVDYLVECDPGEGTINAYNCAGLPQEGDNYSVSPDDQGPPEIDLWAFATQETSVTELLSSGEPNRRFMVSRNFSTENNKRCADQKVEDPVNEPPKVSFNTQETKEEITVDLFGNFVENSAHEQIRGPQVEFEASTISISVDMNVLTAAQGYIIPISLTNCVNADYMWGLPPRTVRLSRVSGERKYYGQCNIYYSRKLEFQVHYLLKTDPEGNQTIENWDRRVLDEGTKVLRGHWERTPEGVRWVLDPLNGIDPDPDNIKDFIPYPSPPGGAGAHTKVILDGHGQPAGSDTTDYNRYICVIAAPPGILLTDVTHWLQQLSYTSWSSVEQYEVGDVVLNLASLGGDDEEYVCFQTNIDDRPDTDPTSWILLPNGVNEAAGMWLLAGNYAVGDSVTNGEGRKTTAGSIFVAKYPGVDFITALGLPNTI